MRGESINILQKTCYLSNLFIFFHWFLKLSRFNTSVYWCERCDFTCFLASRPPLLLLLTPNWSLHGRMTQGKHWNIGRTFIEGVEKRHSYGEKSICGKIGPKTLKNALEIIVNVTLFQYLTCPSVVDFWATKGKWKEWVFLYKQNNYKALHCIAFLGLEKYSQWQ